MKGRPYFFQLVVVSAIILVGSGCGRLSHWVPHAINQGKPVETYTHTVYHNIRSLTLHDQFTMVGMFDALLLTDRVHKAYASTYAQLYRDSSYQEVLDARRALFDKGIFLYVLTLSSTLLDSQNAIWSIFLKKNGVIYEPSDVELIAIDPIIHLFFGDFVSRFKQAYLICFKGVLIQTNDADVALCIRSFDREGKIVWNLCNGEPEQVAYQSYPHF